MDNNLILAEEQQLQLQMKQMDTRFALSPVGQMVKQFEATQRIAQMYSQATIVPDTYKGNVANCGIAIELATRLNMPPMMVMQNLYVVHGNPAWSSKFLIACVNGCGRYTTLQYQETDADKGSDDYGVRCVAYERDDIKRERPLYGPWVTWRTVKAEGWLNKNGSKWKTMPDLMFRYRAAAQWQRTYAPDLGMGILTVEEQHDMADTIEVKAVDVSPAPAPAPAPKPEVDPRDVKVVRTMLGNTKNRQEVIDLRNNFRKIYDGSDELREAVIDRMRYFDEIEQQQQAAPASDGQLPLDQPA